MNPTAMNGEVNPARFCSDCDEPIKGDAACHDGELMCARCDAYRRRRDIEDELTENQGEFFSVMSDLDEQREAFSREIEQMTAQHAERIKFLETVLATWKRRVQDSIKRLAKLDAEINLPAVLAPIAGGAPEFEPSPEDWEDYRHWCEEVDRRDEIRSLENHQNPMWGYE